MTVLPPGRSRFQVGELSSKPSNPRRAGRTELGRTYRDAGAMNGWADQNDLRLRFDVLTKTKQPEPHGYWTQRDQAANVRLSPGGRVIRAIELGVFVPNPGWQCRECQFRSRCWAGR